MIYQAKVASRKEWAMDDTDEKRNERRKKCKLCGGVGYFGALDTNPDLVVWCKCVVLKQFDHAAFQKRTLGGNVPAANLKKL